MSSLKVKQIQSKIRAMFERHLDLNDIGVNDKERDVKILSRCLAALAIFHETGCSEEQAAKAVWDGGGDNGIDAASYDQSEASVVITQAKWIKKGSGEPEEKDIAVFTKGVRALIEQDTALFSSKIQIRLNDILQKLNTPGTKVKIIVISTGSSTLAPPSQNTIHGFISELNGSDPDPIAFSEVLGLAEVYKLLSATSSSASISIDAAILDWAHIPSPYPAYIGTIDGLQLKNWWSKYGKRLVSANIRHALGATEVNNEIKNTANNEPGKFWYFNNGITLICDDALKAPAAASSRSFGNFTFRAASIVNGAQTVSSLAKVENDNTLSDIKVQIKIIELKGAPSGFGDEVTRTNNLQNRVEYRDFVTQDPEQKRLQQEMAMEDIEYQYVRSEDTISTDTNCDLTEVTTALACAFNDSAYAVHIKTGIGRFFQDLTKGPYKAIFNPSVSGARAFNCVVVLRHIDKWIEAKKKGVGKRSGTAWGALVHGNRIIASSIFHKIPTDTTLTPISEFSKNLDRTAIDTHCEDVYQKVVDRLNTTYNGKFLAVLFKNPTACRDIYDYAK